MRILAICGASLGVVVLGIATASVTRPATPASMQAPKLSPSAPSDFPSNSTQADAVAFAWQSFVALNWPALAGVRGVPDTTKTIGQPGVVVWSTWKAPEEIFLPLAQPPGRWDQSGGVLPAECKGKVAGALASQVIIRRVSKVAAGASPELELAQRNVAHVRDQQVLGGTLTDQHGNLVRYELRVNRTIFDAIVAKRYYDRAVQDRAGMITLPNSVMEVKAAWREMTPADSAVATRYLRRSALIYTPAVRSTRATCVQRELGLVGLHIAQKIPSLKGWAWATFEQVDNVPPFGKTGPVPGRTLPFSFNNPACPVTKCVPNQSTEDPPGHPTTVPTQVTRLNNVDTTAQRVNPAWQKALADAVPGSPFAFYQLIGMQWRKGQYGETTPNTLANTVLETYVTESSCMNCHSIAKTASGRNTSDYSYILAEAQWPLTQKAAHEPPRKAPR